MSDQCYYLIHFIRYEEGRISQTGNAQFSCAISIKRGLQTDNGTWICQISVLDENTHVQSLKANIDVVVTGTPLQFIKVLNNLCISITFLLNKI